MIPARPESGLWMGFPGFLYFSLNISTPLLKRMADRQAARLGNVGVDRQPGPTHATGSHLPISGGDGQNAYYYDRGFGKAGNEHNSR